MIWGGNTPLIFLRRTMRFIVNETDPKELVIVDKRTHRQIGKFVNGVLDTENPKLILKLKSRFKTIEVEPVQEEPIEFEQVETESEINEPMQEETIHIKDENNTLYHCNKCDFKAEKHSDLMNHYKKIHPKEKKYG